MCVENMKYSVIISFVLLLAMFSCQKEIIVPVHQNTDEVFETRSGRNPVNNDGGNGSVTDPDNETEDDKVRKKKKTASN
jgi:hypothetical protein